MSGNFMSGADMSGAVLSGADMSGAVLSGAVMSGPFCRGRFVTGRFDGSPHKLYSSIHENFARIVLVVLKEARIVYFFNQRKRCSQ